MYESRELYGHVVVDGAKVRRVERLSFADGYAMRYVLPPHARAVTDEKTTWTLPLTATVWFQAGDAKTSTVNYEAPYSCARVADLKVGALMALPITAKLADGTYRMITEANVVDYSDLAVVYTGDGTFTSTLYADPAGFFVGGVKTTPWRVTIVAKDLNALANSDMVRRLCPEAPKDRRARVAESFPKPGRCIWQWLPAGDPKYAEQKDWYDRTKALGFEYYLIDDGWKKWSDGDLDRWACLRKAIAYGESIGVKTFIWADSKEMPESVSRLDYLRKVKATGAVGIKIDFMPKPDARTMQWYEETLRDTYDLGLAVDFHGAVKPTGRERFWPHEMAREAIRGHEWHITRYRRELPPEHDAILPFNRLVQGHADYTPVVFEKKELVRYTWSRELAQGVVFAAPFLCFGDYPKNYEASPAREMIEALPAVYDETIVLPPSDIGACVAVARRKGKDWFVAIENGAKETSVDFPLSFLEGPATMTSYADVPGALDKMDVRVDAVTPRSRVTRKIRPCGGFAAHIVAG